METLRDAASLDKEPSMRSARLHAPSRTLCASSARRLAILATAIATSLPATAQAPDTPILLAPTQGRPVFVAPGEHFRVTAHLPGPIEDVRCALLDDSPPRHRHPLTITPPPNPDVDRTFLCAVPAETPAQTYDLIIESAGRRIVGRHAVAVHAATRRIRIVHLSNMNVGEIGVPDFDDRLVDEINLIAPTLIVTTGDYLDATHPDPNRGWSELSDFLARFDAPTLVACGDHDDLAHYSQTIAPSPIGAIDIGPYRGIVLYDVPANPIATDEGQMQWLARVLADRGPRLTFIVAHAESPTLLHYWHDQGTLAPMIRGGRIGLWFAGGHVDWDGAAYSDVVGDAAPLQYLRTHQASAALRDGATGVSHYRVVDLDGERAVFYGPHAVNGPPRSIPVGRLHQHHDAPNDGSATRVAATIASALDFRINDLTTCVRVRRDGDQRPWCAGGQLAQLVAIEGIWECWVRFDLPDKGAARIVVGTGDHPAAPRCDVSFVGPATLAVTPMTSPDGLAYQRGAWDGRITIENTADTPAEITPLVRLDGSTIAYRVLEEQSPFAVAYRLRLNAGEAVSLQLDLTALKITPGRRELQVYLDGGLARVPTCWPLDVVPARHAAR
jgi:hypothetical protein